MEKEEMNTTMKKDTTCKHDSDSPSGRDTEIMMDFRSTGTMFGNQQRRIIVHDKHVATEPAFIISNCTPTPTSTEAINPFVVQEQPMPRKRLIQTPMMFRGVDQI
jgi:hypothetical protein